MRVLLWSPAGAGEHYHGPGSFSYRLYSTAESGHFRVSLAHGSMNQIDYPLFEDQTLIHPLAARGHGVIENWRFLRKSRRWLDAHHRQFDIFHGLGGFHLTVAPAFHAQRLGLPAVLFIANHRIELTDKPGIKGLLGLPRRRREMVKQLSAIIAMSQAIYDELLEYGISPRKIARIPMGVDTARFHPPHNQSERTELRRSLGWRDVPTLVFVGGVVERKQPHLLVEAIGLLKARGLECQLALVGPASEPAYAQRMKRRAAELGIEPLVIWFGFTKDIAPLFRAANFFSLPSAKEGMPAALVEAMASGLPSIVTPISGATDLIQDGVNGRIIKDDPAQIADALAMYLRDANLAEAHGAAALQTVAERYSARAVLDAYERLFRRIMAGGDAAQ